MQNISSQESVPKKHLLFWSGLQDVQSTVHKTEDDHNSTGLILKLFQLHLQHEEIKVTCGVFPLTASPMQHPDSLSKSDKYTTPSDKDHPFQVINQHGSQS